MAHNANGIHIVREYPNACGVRRTCTLEQFRESIT